MDKVKVKDMRKQIDKALSDIADGQGITLRLGNINFSSDGFRATVICEEMQKDSDLPARYKTDWDEAVAMGIVKEECFGVVTGVIGNQYKVVGYDFKKKKNNILLQKVGTDKIYIASKLHFFKPEFHAGSTGKMNHGDLVEVGIPKK